MLKSNKTYTVEEVAQGCRWFLNVNTKNKKGERLVIELTRCTCDTSSKNAITRRWEAAGFIPRAYESYWSVETYCYDPEGNCWGRYNPQITYNQEEKHACIDFRYLLDGATDENAAALVLEVLGRFCA